MERVASKAGGIVTALRNGFHTGTVEKLVFYLMNREFRPTAEEVAAEILRLKGESKSAKAAQRCQKAAAAAAAKAVFVAAAAAAADQPGRPEVTSPFQPAAANPPPETADDDDDDDMEDIEVDEIGLGKVLEDEEIHAMVDGIAEGRVDPDAAAQADADFEFFLAEVRAEAETGADSATGESA